MDPNASLGEDSPGQSPLTYNGVGMSPTKVGGVWARGSLSPRSLKTSVSEPLFLPDGRTRDGNLIERHATDIHEGKPWRKNVPWAPKEDYDADIAKDAGNRSDLGTTAQNSLRNSVQRDATDIHEGRPWRRSIPWAPSENYGQGDPHPQPPHMRSEVDSVIYGRDIDGSGSGGEVPEWAQGLSTTEMGWSMTRRRSNIHRGVGEPEASSSLRLPVGHEQCAGRRLQQVRGPPELPADPKPGPEPGPEPGRDPGPEPGREPGLALAPTLALALAPALALALALNLALALALAPNLALALALTPTRAPCPSLSPSPSPSPDRWCLGARRRARILTTRPHATGDSGRTRKITTGCRPPSSRLSAPAVWRRL